jgi:hypothetical protein
MKSWLCAVAVLGLVGGAAHAGEDDRSLSVFGGYGTYTIPDHSPAGGVLGLDYERGFSDSMSLRASGGLGMYPLDDADLGASYSGHATIGLTYLFDVLKYVPYVNLGAGAIVLTGGPVEDTTVKGLLELGVGLDILHSRSFSYGVQARLESFIQETSFFSAGVRATWRWGFF